jgi:hypothetical protein
MKLIDTFEVVGFSHWAPALFNGDESGMGDYDISMLREWLSQIPDNADAIPVDMREEGFEHNVYSGIGGDAATFFFPVYEEDQE